MDKKTHADTPDWEWINQLSALPIHDLAAVSLNHEIETVPPVGEEFLNRPNVVAPKEYRERVVLIYDAVRSGALKSTGRTAIRGVGFDPNAELAEGQHWEVSTLDFRFFCDKKKWPVPVQFMPTGYPPSHYDAAPTDKKTGQVHSIKSRRQDLVSHFIEKAQTLSNKKYDVNEVWSNLIVVAANSSGTLQGPTGGGFEYKNAHGGDEFLSLDALRKRLKRRQNTDKGR